MTREEAIKALEIELNQWEADCKSYHAVKEALPMAIEILENENALIDRVLEIIDYYEEQCTKAEGTWLEMARKDILALKGEQ